ncbi:PIG-L deacetylase family protein [Nocardia sp. NPDC088792]|uniref:PIG-L deacetylase family protein n=1 Tax=Nocardia sp. NPDC088792 TaxID=3364332 RepID=UPI0038110EFB
MTVARVLGEARRIVVLSPHFDDAVLAIGALVAGCVESGRTVRVVTVFSAGGTGISAGGRGKAFADYDSRRREDDRALALLGVEARRLGLHERIFRAPAPHGPLSLFHTSRAIAYSPDTAAVHRAIVAEQREDGTIVLAPLGIGNHIDHVITATAALRAARDPARAARMLFYEDFNALAECCRRRHPVARLRPFAFRSAPGWASPRAGLELETMSLLIRGPDAAELAGLPVGPGRWTATALPVSRRHAEAKFAAMAEYRTQTAALGGARQLRALMERAHARRGGELVWQFHGTDSA